MREAIQRTGQGVRQRDIWVISCWGEHGKGLNMNIRYVLLTCKRMRANYVCKVMNYEIASLQASSVCCQTSRQSQLHGSLVLW
jgi:hypothetical protein